MGSRTSGVIGRKSLVILAEHMWAETSDSSNPCTRTENVPPFVSALRFVACNNEEY